MNGLYWMVWVLYVNRAVAMVLLMQLECEWMDGMGVVCESCSRHGVIIDAARM